MNTAELSEESTHTNLYLIQRDNIIKHIVTLEQEIKQMKQKKSKIELLLWDNCDHEWTRDTSACFDDIHKYYCQECSLYKDRRIYLNC